MCRNLWAPQWDFTGLENASDQRHQRRLEAEGHVGILQVAAKTHVSSGYLPGLSSCWAETHKSRLGRNKTEAEEQDDDAGVFFFHHKYGTW